MYSSLSKRKQRLSPPDPQGGDRERQYRYQLTARAGVGATPSVDPVYRLMGDFATQFDAVGRKRAAEMNERSEEHPTEETSEEGRTEQTNGAKTPTETPSETTSTREKLTASELRRRHDSPVYSHSAYELATGSFYDRFSSHAFNCGTLAASVMAGQGKVMFTSCCRRAGTFRPAGSQFTSKILSAKSTTVSMRNQPGTLVFDGEVKAAVGIVADSIRSASRVLDMFKQAAVDNQPHSDNKLQKNGVETMQDLYPFLQLDEDTRLIAEYREQLKALENTSTPEGLRQKKHLDAALRKAVAVKERKMAEQRRFLTALNRITANVAEAEKLFSSDGFAEGIIAELEETPDLPDGDESGRRRTLEDSPLDALLDALLGTDNEPSEADDGEGQIPTGEGPADGAEATAEA